MIISRRLPINIKNSDINLFKHELLFEFTNPSHYIIKNIFIDSDINKISYTKLLGINHLKFLIKKIIFIEFNALVNLFYNNIFCITDDWSYGYFHWMLDCLPKLIYLNPIVPKGKLLLPSHLLKHAFVLESLKLLGYSNFTFVEPGSIIFAKRLWQLNNYPTTGNYIPELVLDLRRTLFLKSQYSPNINLYISRRFASRRKLSNEEQIHSILKKYNFAIVFPELLSLNDQALLFSKCNNLISLHGAGLSNMLFVDNNCKILELRPKNDSLNNCYFSLASALDLEYLYLLCDCERANDNSQTFNYVVNEHDLEKVIKLMLNE